MRISCPHHRKRWHTPIKLVTLTCSFTIASCCGTAFPLVCHNFGLLWPLLLLHCLYVGFGPASSSKPSCSSSWSIPWTFHIYFIFYFIYPILYIFCPRALRILETPIPYHFRTYILRFSSSSPQLFVLSNTEVSPLFHIITSSYLLYLAVTLRYYNYSCLSYQTLNHHI